MAFWRRMIGLCGALCVLLLTVEAVEFYDDIPGLEPDVIYQDENYPDIEPLGPDTNPRYEDPLKDLILYKLLKNIRDNEELYTTTFYKPKYTFEDKNLPRDVMKEPVKRLTHALATLANVPKITKPVVVPQLKWKKKVKPVELHDPLTNPTNDMKEFNNDPISCVTSSYVQFGRLEENSKEAF